MHGAHSDRFRGPSDSPPASFRSFLSRLKSRGSGLLVTGENPGWVRQHASRQLFGTTRLHDGEPPRRRVVVTTDAATDPAKYLPTGTSVGDDLVRVVSHTSPTRSTAVASAPDASGGPSITDGTAELGTAVVEVVDSLAADDGGVAPGELRVGITSLRPLVEADGLDTVLDFCAEVAEAVRGHNGMAHFHYPLADADAAVDRLASPLDARVELRQEGGDPVQCRWHTPYPELHQDLGWVNFG